MVKGKWPVVYKPEQFYLCEHLFYLSVRNDKAPVGTMRQTYILYIIHKHKAFN